MAKLSIVIPVYNVERYIRACLDSIMGQTFSAFEVILVDDGSTDGSGAICRWFARYDNRFRVISQKNTGVSDARNKGIGAAGGEFLTFVDPDDWISPNYYENMVLVQQKYDAGVVESKTEFVSESNKRIFPEYVAALIAQQEEVVLNGKREILEGITSNLFNCLSWNKLFKRELWGNARYPVKLSLGEDMATVVDVVAHAERAVYTPESVYYYRHRSDSLLHSKVDKKRFYEDLEGSEIMRDKLMAHAPDYKNSIEMLKLYYDMGCIAQYVKQREKKSLLYALTEIAPGICNGTDNQLVKKVFGILEHFAPTND